MLDQVHTFVMSNLGGAAATTAIVVEFLLRMVPTSKPLSMLYVIGPTAHKIADILNGVVSFLDKVLPQNIAK